MQKQPLTIIGSISPNLSAADVYDFAMNGPSLYARKDGQVVCDIEGSGLCLSCPEWIYKAVTQINATRGYRSVRRLDAYNDPLNRLSRSRAQIALVTENGGRNSLRRSEEFERHARLFAQMYPKSRRQARSAA